MNLRCPQRVTTPSLCKTCSLVLWLYRSGPWLPVPVKCFAGCQYLWNFECSLPQNQHQKRPSSSSGGLLIFTNSGMKLAKHYQACINCCCCCCVMGEVVPREAASTCARPNGKAASTRLTRVKWEGACRNMWENRSIPSTLRERRVNRSQPRFWGFAP